MDSPQITHSIARGAVKSPSTFGARAQLLHNIADMTCFQLKSLLIAGISIASLASAQASVQKKLPSNTDKHLSSDKRLSEWKKFCTQEVDGGLSGTSMIVNGKGGHFRLQTNGDHVQLVKLNNLPQKKIDELEKSGLIFQSLLESAAYLKPDEKSHEVGSEITRDGFRYRVTHSGIDAEGKAEATVERIDEKTGAVLITARNKIDPNTYTLEFPLNLEAMAQNGKNVELLLHRGGFANPIVITNGESTQTIIRGGVPTPSSFTGNWHAFLLEALEQFNIMGNTK